MPADLDRLQEEITPHLRQAKTIIAQHWEGMDTGEREALFTWILVHFLKPALPTPEIPRYLRNCAQYVDDRLEKGEPV